MAETKRCIQCGAVLPEDAAFCPHCTCRATCVAVQWGQKDASCASGAPQWGHFLSVFVMSVTAPPAAPAPSDTAAPGWSWCSAAPPARRDPPPAAGRDAAR